MPESLFETAGATGQERNIGHRRRFPMQCFQFVGAHLPQEVDVVCPGAWLGLAGQDQVKVGDSEGGESGYQVRMILVSQRLGRIEQIAVSE